MSKQTRWLTGELERWQKAQIITEDQALRIRGLYAEPAPSVSWGLVVFSGLGAVVLGLGVILLLAYNWDAIPKFGKLGIVFGSMAAAHAAGVFLRREGGWKATLGDVFSLLGSMLFGAGIWLVAQVYHIDEHFPNGFLIWGLGALALAWAWESVLQALLATVTLAIWCVSEATAFDRPVDWAFLLLVAGVGGLAWKRRSTLLTTVLLAAVYVVTLVNGGAWGGAGAVFSTAFGLSALLIALPRLIDERHLSPGMSKVMLVFGWVGFLVCSYILGFRGVAREVLRWHEARETGLAVFFAYRWLVVLLAGAAWLALLFKWLRAGRKGVKIEDWLCPIALLYSHMMAVTEYYEYPEFVSIVFNLIGLGLATAWMVRGCREGLMLPVVGGSVLLALLVFARYFDLFDSLATRGIAFLVLGGVLFAEGFYYRRMRMEAAEERKQP